MVKNAKNTTNTIQVNYGKSPIKDPHGNQKEPNNLVNMHSIVEQKIMASGEHNAAGKAAA